MARNTSAVVAKLEYFNTGHLKGELRRSAITGGGITIFSRGVNLIIQMGGTMILGRLLTPIDFGLVAMVTTVVGIFMIFKDLGLEDTTIQSENITHEQVSALFWLNVGFGCLICIGVALFSPLFAYFYHEPKVQAISVVFGLGFIFAGFTTQHAALLQRNMEFRKIALMGVTAQLLSTVAAIFLAVSGLGYWALVIRQLISNFVIMASVWILCEWRPTLLVRNSGAKSLLKFGANNVAFSLSNWVGNGIYGPLIGSSIGAEALGLFRNAAYFASLPVTEVIMPLHAIAVSTLSKLRDDPERFRRYYLKAVSNIMIVAVPSSMFLVVMSEEVVVVLLGSQWAQTAPLVSILGIAATVDGLLGTVGWLHLSLGRADRRLIWGVVRNVFFALSLFAGLAYGLRGVAFFAAVAQFVLIGPGVWYGGKPVNLKFRSVLSGIWRFYIASIAGAVLCWQLSHFAFVWATPILKISVLSIIFAIVYLVGLTILHRSIDPVKELVSLVFDLIPNRFGR